MYIRNPAPRSWFLRCRMPLTCMKRTIQLEKIFWHSADRWRYSVFWRILPVKGFYCRMRQEKFCTATRVPLRCSGMMRAQMYAEFFLRRGMPVFMKMAALFLRRNIPRCIPCAPESPVQMPLWVLRKMGANPVG